MYLHSRTPSQNVREDAHFFFSTPDFKMGAYDTPRRRSQGYAKIKHSPDAADRSMRMYAFEDLPTDQLGLVFVEGKPKKVSHPGRNRNTSAFRPGKKGDAPVFWVPSSTFQIVKKTNRLGGNVFIVMVDRDAMLAKGYVMLKQILGIIHWSYQGTKFHTRPLVFEDYTEDQMAQHLKTLQLKDFVVHFM